MLLKVVKPNLKGDDNTGNWFLPLQLYVLSKLSCLPVSEITQTEIRNTLTLYLVYKSGLKFARYSL